nr:Valine--pyruvate aminotransferase [Candidatus Pantoea persica]
MAFSQFGDKFTQHTGISHLMEDMGAGLRTPGTIMLGGGNPAQIPAINNYFQQLQQMHNEGKLSEALCNYDGPRGWPVTAQNTALTNGSQSAFFYLFNLFAGRRADGGKKRVLFPLAPEYLGDADAGLDEGLFVSRRPVQIPHRFLPSAAA